ncbi:SAP domain-containing ribonucleoprotein [Galleria mellonella]|uniref:SAP domain-containing ribonucleoprotein n=1 Tax=Galleria mellonella TaxID=7137 RepID=A0A6J1WYM6_GALME|nr:SAP domain-containing ribonucleoprotein [Galleria mellonella]
MADSTVTDVSKMKVVELRKELKSRGLSHVGDKAELVARLQAAMSQDDINLDWEDLDSDGVLEDEDDKNQTDILDEPVVENASSEELVLAEQPPPPEVVSESKPPQKSLKRKIAISEVDKKKPETKSAENKDSAKKIVLNRASSVTVSTKPAEEKVQEKHEKIISSESNKIKITADLDPKTRLEMRAKRFGLPIQMTEAERKEARKQRFSQNTTPNPDKETYTGSLNENLLKLKKRAERFGQNVSKIMTDIENKEKLEKRKEKFGTVK